MFVTRKFGNVERNSHCDVLHITPIRVARLFLDCNGVLAIKAYRVFYDTRQRLDVIQGDHIEVFKILNGYENIYSNVFFKLRKVKYLEGTTTRW